MKFRFILHIFISFLLFYADADENKNNNISSIWGNLNEKLTEQKTNFQRSLNQIFTEHKADFEKRKNELEKRGRNWVHDKVAETVAESVTEDHPKWGKILKSSVLKYLYNLYFIFISFIYFIINFFNF